MEYKKLVPKRRFTGFTDAWEKRKLGEVADIIGGGTPSTGNEEYWGGDINWYSPVEIGDQPYVDSSQKKITELGLQKSSAKILPIGTVLFTSRAGIGKTAILAKEGATNQGFQSIVPHNDELDSYFIYSRTHELKRYGESNGAGSTFVEVSGKQMAKMPMFIPTLEEQIKIGNLFKKIDNMIDLQQSKLEKTKTLKSAYLAEMFPAEGEQVPKRRFTGYTDEWEEQRLGDGTLKIGDGLHGTPKFTENGDVFFINGNNLINGKIVINEETKRVTEAEQSKDDKTLNEKTILMSINGTIGNLAWYRGEKLMLGKSTAYIIVNGFDKKFVYAYLQTNRVYNYFMNNLTGTTIKNLGLKTIRDTILLVPSIGEQQKIGSFFEQLDNMITSHQRKLDKLKAMKQAYLHEMFV